MFDEAIEAIPYDLTPTSITQGEFEPDEKGFVEYSAEFTFPVGRLFDEELVAGGWVDLRQDDGEIYISGLFSIARKVTKNRAAFPSPEAARKLLWLAHRDIAKKWTMPIPHWPIILNQLAIRFENRFPI
jgi:hypothetical protein